MALDNDGRIPYWLDIWPASLGLAEWLEKASGELKGRLCLDLGCGLGLTALVGQSLGANVLGADYEHLALSFCQQNAEINHVQGACWVLADWSMPAFAAGVFSRIWGADIAYERDSWDSILDFFDRALAFGGRVWLAEPGRSVFQSFLERADMRGWRGGIVHSRTASAVHDSDVKIKTDVWEFCRE